MLTLVYIIMHKIMISFKSRLLSAVVVAFILLTSSPLIANWASNSNRYWSATTCSIWQNKELRQFERELKQTQQKFWSAEGSVNWYKKEIRQLKREIRSAKGTKKIKLQNKLSTYENNLSIYRQKMWDAEWAMDWYEKEIKKLKKEIKKLDKDCDNYGYGHDNGKKNGNKGSWKAWWKKW